MNEKLHYFHFSLSKMMYSERLILTVGISNTFEQKMSYKQPRFDRNSLSYICLNLHCHPIVYGKCLCGNNQSTILNISR